MTPGLTLDTADISGGGGQLRLIRRGADAEVVVVAAWRGAAGGCVRRQEGRCPPSHRRGRCAAPDPRFTRRLQDAGFAVEEVAVKARGSRGARHVIWVATRA